MRPKLELLPTLLVDVGRPQHSPALTTSREGDWTPHHCTRLLRRPHNVGRRLVDHPVIERFQSNSDSFSHFGLCYGGQPGQRPRHSRFLSCPAIPPNSRRGPLVAKDPRSLPCYSMISVTTPEPTVRPPSRIANRSCGSIAIGVINSTSIWTLSPGITISTPSGRFAAPVTSVVRK
mgnify:FL=1